MSFVVFCNVFLVKPFANALYKGNPLNKYLFIRDTGKCKCIEKKQLKPKKGLYFIRIIKKNK